MTNAIQTKLVSLGFSVGDSIEIVKALKTYVRCEKRQWRGAMHHDWCRSYYPYLTERQGGLMQAVRNGKACEYVLKLTAPKINAETF